MRECRNPCRVLLLKKETSSALQRESLASLEKRGVLPVIYAQELERADLEHTETLHRIRAMLVDLGCNLQEIFQTDPWPNEPLDYVITVGGDGTVLMASHFIEDDRTPIVGIRSSSGSVGRLCAFDYRDLDCFADSLQSRDVPRLQLQRLRAEITDNRNGSKRLTKAVLNDILYTNANPAATTRYAINFCDGWENHKSSGVWISTAAGSSAAIDAAGGHLMDVTSNNYQFRVRELYREVGNQIVGQEFDLNDQTLIIHSLCDQALLSLDGQHRAVPILYGDSIKFKIAPAIAIAKPSGS